MKKSNPIRELYWAIKTRHLAKGWTLLEYFCWRIVRSHKLTK